MWLGCYVCLEIRSEHVESITDDLESCQNAISAFTTHVNVGEFALGQGGDLQVPKTRANHHPDPVQNHLHLHELLAQKAFNFTVTKSILKLQTCYPCIFYGGSIGVIS